MDITSGMPAFLEPHSSVNMIYNQQFGTVDSAPNLSRRNAFRRRSHENGAYREHVSSNLEYPMKLTNPTAHFQTVRPSRPRIVPPYNTESGSFAPIEVGYESQLQLSPRNTVVNATKSRSRRPRNNTPTSREPLPRSLQDGERSSPNSSSLQMQRNPSQDQLNQYQNPTQLGCISDVVSKKLWFVNLSLTPPFLLHSRLLDLRLPPMRHNSQRRILVLQLPYMALTRSITLDLLAQGIMQLLRLISINLEVSREPTVLRQIRRTTSVGRVLPVSYHLEFSTYGSCSHSLYSQRQFSTPCERAAQWIHQ